MALDELRRQLWHLRHGGPGQWRRYLRRRLSAGPDSVRSGTAGIEYAEWPLPERAPARGVRVAVIADDFTRLALGYEWEQVEITPEDWRELTLDGDRPIVDLLFVESAWHGNGDAWQYHLTGTSAPRPAFVELVQTLRGAGVPTVFWNKEDPVHYADFLASARLFDHVFTTDSNRLADYRRDLGHDRVGVLPFAVQPAIHNPIRPRSGHASRDIGFGGMYFAHKYPERREQMDLLLGAADRVSPRMAHGLEIFSRYLGGDERYQFPSPLDERVVGSLDYRQMLSAYRAFKVFLNVNSVVDSPSMCARRVFEITACGTPVVSTPSPAIENFFPRDEVIQVDDQQDAEWMLRALVRSPELRDRMVHAAQRRIWSEHTYGHRVDDVLTAAGVAAPRVALPPVSLLVSTNRPHQLRHVFETVAGLVDVEVELCLLTHGFDPADGLAGLRDEFGVENLRHVVGPAEWPLGRCLNELRGIADAEVVAKIDDDDDYGPHYLRDQLFALAYSGADVVGKQAHYVHLAGRELTALRFPEREHKFTDLVMGPTIVTTRSVLAEHPFAELGRGEDTAMLRAVGAAGGRIYSADRFNFVLERRIGTVHRHTWDAADAEILANADVVAASSKA